MRPAEAQLIPTLDAPPVDEVEDAAAEALIEGEPFVFAVVEDPPAIVPPDEVPPIFGPEADADAVEEGVIVTCAGTAGPVELPLC